MRRVVCKDFKIEYIERGEHRAYVIVGITHSVDEEDRLKVETYDSIAVFEGDTKSVEEFLHEQNPEAVWIVIPLAEYLDGLSREVDLEGMLNKFLN